MPRYRLTDWQLRVVSALEAHRGDGPVAQELADELGTTSGAMNYHLRGLTKQGRARCEREGYKRRWYLVGADSRADRHQAAVERLAGLLSREPEDGTEFLEAAAEEIERRRRG